MRLTLASLVLAAGLPAQTAEPKPPYGALTDAVQAGEIVLRDVCLPGILERKVIGTLAEQAYLVGMPPRSANAGPNDKVWRLGSLQGVYAVAWADGSCSTYVDGGPADKLRTMAEAAILARPEGFARGRSGPVAGGQVERTVYCAMIGGERLVATITTPSGKAPRGVRALSSTVYRAPGPSPLCQPS